MPIQKSRSLEFQWCLFCFVILPVTKHCDSLRKRPNPLILQSRRLWEGDIQLLREMSCDVHDLTVIQRGWCSPGLPHVLHLSQSVNVNPKDLVEHEFRESVLASLGQNSFKSLGFYLQRLQLLGYIPSKKDPLRLMFRSDSRPVETCCSVRPYRFHRRHCLP